MIKSILAHIGFCALFIATGFIISAQFPNTPPSPPHVSAITPPPIPFDQPFLRPYPKDAYMIHIPADKTPGRDGLLSIGNMQMEELLERVRTNKYNLYLLELRPKPESVLVPVMVTPEDASTLSNLHNLQRGEPQHP